MSFVFESFGRVRHLRIRSAADLRRALELDEAHWVAVTAPVVSFNGDAAFFRELDSDGDGRIRAEDVKSAIRWLLDHDRDADGIDTRQASLQVDSISQEAADGARMRQAAAKILKRRGGSDALVSLEEVRKVRREEEARGMSDAGWVSPAAAGDETVRQLLTDVLACLGDPSRPIQAQAVSREMLDRFLADVRAYEDWFERGDPDGANPDPAVTPLGRDTQEAYKAFLDVESKVDQYFALASLAQIDPKAPQWASASSDSMEQASRMDSSALDALLRDLPAAEIRTDGILDLSGPLNPRHAEVLERFQERALPNLLGQPSNTLTARQWRKIKATFEPRRQWERSRPPGRMGELPRDRARRHLADARAFEKAAELLERSREMAFDKESLRLLERLLLFRIWMLPFANSFVSFPDLYHPERRALFEMGTLILDGRCYSLAVRVIDRALHAKFSDASNMFVLYVEVFEREGQKRYEVAVPVTSGVRGALQSSKWGVFHDVSGREWPARVAHIVENPISFSEALWAPFKRMGRAISLKFEERAGEAEKKLETAGAQAADYRQTASPSDPKKADASGPAMGGLLAGGAIAIAALGSSAAYVSGKLLAMGWQARFGILIGAALAVLLPTMIVATIKLAKRDLSAILDGAGWGINARMRLTRKQAREFTYRPDYPADSSGVVRGRGPFLWILGAVFAAWIVYAAALAAADWVW